MSQFKNVSSWSHPWVFGVLESFRFCVRSNTHMLTPTRTHYLYILVCVCVCLQTNSNIELNFLSSVQLSLSDLNKTKEQIILTSDNTFLFIRVFALEWNYLKSFYTSNNTEISRCLQPKKKKKKKRSLQKPQLNSIVKIRLTWHITEHLFFQICWDIKSTRMYFGKWTFLSLNLDSEIK